MCRSEKWVAKLLEYKAMKIVLNDNGKERYKALHRGKLINKSDIEILSAYNAEIRGLYNFYSRANVLIKLGRLPRNEYSNVSKPLQISTKRTSTEYGTGFIATAILRWSTRPKAGKASRILQSRL